MITLGDYLGFLMTEIARARLTSDLASIDLAKIYSENELLKNLSVPRVRLSRIDVSVPLVIESLKTDQISSFKGLNARENQDILSKDLAEVFLKYFQIKFSKEESNNISARIRLGMETIARANAYHDGRNKFEQLTEEISTYALNLKELSGLPEYSNRLDQFLSELRSKFLGQFELLVKPGEGKLGSMIVNPETAAVRAVRSHELLLVLKLSLTEEGVELVTVQDSEGNTKKVMVIE
jgi:hypothetical protein